MVSSKSVKIQEEEVNLNCYEYIIAMSFFTLLSFLSLWLLLKYIKNLWPLRSRLNIFIPLYMWTLAISIAWDVIFGGFQVYFKSHKCAYETDQCLGHFTVWVNFFAYLATVVTLCFMYWSQIGERIVSGSERKRCNNILWMILITILVVISAFFFGDSIETWTTQKEEYSGYNDIVRIISVGYVVTGLAFTAIILVFYVSIKRFHPDRNNSIGVRLLLSFFIVFLSFEARGVITFIRTLGEDFIKSFRESYYETQGWWYPVYIFCFYTLLSLFPTIVQIYLLRVRLRYVKLERKGAIFEIEPSGSFFNTSGEYLQSQAGSRIFSRLDLEEEFDKQYGSEVLQSRHLISLDQSTL